MISADIFRRPGIVFQPITLYHRNWKRELWLFSKAPKTNPRKNNPRSPHTRVLFGRRAQHNSALAITKACMTSFTELGLGTPITRALALEGHDMPTPIQTQAIPTIIEGRDLLGIAQTGTGKTAAFALPILNRISSRKLRIEQRSCRVLVLSPTRELASQIQERFEAYGRFLPLSTSVAIGGVAISRQRRALAAGVDVLIATPGRLVDLLQSGSVRLDRVEIFVLDEADRMLDMGFIRPIRQIAAQLPKHRQTLLFSATMPAAIKGLATSFLNDPAEVAVTPVAKAADRVSQQAVFVNGGDKAHALLGILTPDTVQRALVFARTKRGADRIVKGLASGGISADAIHGNKSQQQRERALGRFRQGKTRVLVATDIAARGIDVPAVTHVINYDLPADAESYVHRIGRTARAGAEGVAISICTQEDGANLRAIEKLIGLAIPVTGAVSNNRPGKPPSPTPKNRRGRRRRGAYRSGRSPELRAA